MAKKETASPAIPVFPMLKTVEQMSKISGIGENKLRELMDSGELEWSICSWDAGRYSHVIFGVSFGSSREVRATVSKSAS